LLSNQAKKRAKGGKAHLPGPRLGGDRVSHNRCNYQEKGPKRPASKPRKSGNAAGGNHPGKKEEGIKPTTTQPERDEWDDFKKNSRHGETIWHRSGKKRKKRIRPPHGVLRKKKRGHERENWRTEVPRGVKKWRWREPFGAASAFG